MLGWFVGVLRSGAKEYAVAANASDLVPATPPAGPRLRDTTVEILTGMGLVK
jgi:beta-lactamase class D